MVQFKSLSDFFKHISTQNYLVLRNYEDFDSPSFLKDHPDIDFLCDNARKFASVACATPRGERDDGIHYIINVSGLKIPIDVREVGDGYFDSKWEKRALETREFFNCFFVMDLENYFYSLIYHAMIQKKELSLDYSIRISNFAKKMGEDPNPDSFIATLERYMRKMGYKYTYPRNHYTTFNLIKSDSRLVKFSFSNLIFQLRVKLSALLKSRGK